MRVLAVGAGHGGLGGRSARGLAAGALCAVAAVDAGGAGGGGDAGGHLGGGPDGRPRWQKRSGAGGGGRSTGAVDRTGGAHGMVVAVGAGGVCAVPIVRHREALATTM